MAEKTIQINNKTELRINTLNDIVAITKDGQDFYITENELNRIYHALKFYRYDYPVDVR